MINETILYDSLENEKIHRYLCNHHCKIPESK